MEQERKNKVLEVTAIIILILLLWRVFCKIKPVVILAEKGDVVTEALQINNQFKGQPTNCENIVAKPLAQWGPVPADLTLGRGWCHRGDGSFFDGKEIVYGTEYADEQAQNYADKKQIEAIRGINKKVIMVRLINNRPSKITTPVFDITQDPYVFDGTDDIGNTSRELLTEIGENILKENGEKILVV